MLSSSISSQFLCDLKVTASLNYSSLQVFFPALAAGESMLTDEERSSSDPLRIPDTVLYNYGKPIERYGNDTTVLFGSKKRGGANASDAAGGGRRVTRLSGRLTTEGIWDDFSLSQCPTTRRSAMWMEEANESTAALSQMRDVLVDVQCQEPDQSNLRLFLQRIKGKGMLQQVVETKRESDGSARCVMFLCHYSQHRFSVDKLTSLYLVAGTGGTEMAPPPSLIFSPHFGSYHVSVVPASRTFTQLRRHSDRVALCLSRVYKAHVAAMTLVFRFGADESLYLSWCDSVSLCQMSVPIGGGGGSDTNGASTSDGKFDGSNGSSSSGSGSGGSKGPITYVIDAHGSRVASSSPPKHAAKGTKFALSDPRDEMFACAVCHTSYCRGELGRVQLRWLLMALSMMDTHVKGWHGDVPPSVALVCPDMTVAGFRRLQEIIESEPMFRLICTDCSSRAEASIQRMTNSKIRAPAWLGVDKITVGRKASALRKEIRVQHTPEEDNYPQHSRFDLSAGTYSGRRHKNSTVSIDKNCQYTVVAFTPQNDAPREKRCASAASPRISEEMSAATSTTTIDNTDLGTVKGRVHDDDDDDAVSGPSIININKKETRATCEGPAAVHMPLPPHDALPLYEHKEGMWRPIKRGRSKVLVRPTPLTLFGGQLKSRNDGGECGEKEVLGPVIIDEDVTETEFRDLLADKLSTLAAAAPKDEGNETADKRGERRGRMDGPRHLRDNDIATYTPCSTPLQQKDLDDRVVF